MWDDACRHHMAHLMDQFCRLFVQSSCIVSRFCRSVNPLSVASVEAWPYDVELLLMTMVTQRLKVRSGVLRCRRSDLCAFGRSVVRALRRGGARVFGRSVIRVFGRSGVQAFKSSCARLFGRSGVRVLGCSGVRAFFGAFGPSGFVRSCVCCYLALTTTQRLSLITTCHWLLQTYGFP